MITVTHKGCPQTSEGVRFPRKSVLMIFGAVYQGLRRLNKHSTVAFDFPYFS
jgi:hypothetical protein